MVSFSALPGPSGSGSSSVSPWKSTRSRASAILTHRHVLARALQLFGEALPVPALGDLGAGGADAEQHAPVGELVDRGGRSWRSSPPSGPASGRSPSRAGSSRSGPRASRARWRRRTRRPPRSTPSRSRGARPPARSSSWSCELRPMPQYPRCTPSFIRKFPFRGRDFLAARGRRAIGLARLRPAGSRTPPGGHSLCQSAAPATAARPVPHALRLAIDCMPVATREAMLAGVRDSDRIIAGAYVDEHGGVCPMLAAHRRGGRTDFLSFARSWDRFTRARGKARPATAREIAILSSQLQDSLETADGLRARPRDRRAPAAAPRAPRPAPPRAPGARPARGDPRPAPAARRRRLRSRR